ncbi:MAG: DNA-directed RNA polymerase subunit H [Thermoplasmata archaeon]|nr:DNA-directed RNA polymerase subunit H [Euryarchaeota archaeon]RLF66908.1 MAG: DNA-directed RNA polymerase subunit H [Thermoplasmata archaeon]
MTTKISSEELKRRILEHDYVPTHIKLSEEEAKKVLERYNIIPQQLPKILSTDPIVQIIGANPGDIIMIIRESPTGGVSIAYRYVVPDLEKEKKPKRAGSRKHKKVSEEEMYEGAEEESIEEEIPLEILEEMGYTEEEGNVDY